MIKMTKAQQRRQEEKKALYEETKARFHDLVQGSFTGVYEDEPETRWSAKDTIEWTLRDVVYCYDSMNSYWKYTDVIPVSEQIPITEAMANYLQHIAGLMREATVAAI